MSEVFCTFHQAATEGQKILDQASEGASTRERGSEASVTAEESDDATFNDLTGALRSAQDEIAVLRAQCHDHDALKLRCAHLEEVLSFSSTQLHFPFPAAFCLLLCAVWTCRRSGSPRVESMGKQVYLVGRTQPRHGKKHGSTYRA
jgi:hypothetical protein